MFAKDREAMRLTPAEVRLILIESLQWCANNAVYFLGLIGAATYDLAGTAFLVAAITLVRNLMTSAGNMVSGSVIDRFGPRRTSFVTCVITAVLSLGVGLAPLSVPGLVFAACVLGLAGGFINTCTHAFPGYLESTTEGRTRVNGLMVFYSNIAYTAGPLLGGAIVSCFATQSVYLLMAGMMGVAAVLSLGCHECVAPAKGEKPKGGILGGMAEGARLTFCDHDLRLIFISGFLLNVDIVWLGWLSSVVGLTSSVGAFILTKLSARHVNLRLLLGALMAVGIGSMVYVGTDMLGVAIIGQAINGLAWGFLEPLQMILIQERADIKYLGRITGFVRFGLMSAGVLPLLAAPFLAEALGVQTVLFGASTIIALVGTLFFVTQGRRQRR